MAKIKLSEKEQERITAKSLEHYNNEIEQTKKSRAKNKITKAFNYAICFSFSSCFCSYSDI